MSFKNSLNKLFRVFLMLIIVLLLAFGGLFWFDFLGIVDARIVLSPLRNLIGLNEQYRPSEIQDPLLLDRERLASREEALMKLRDEIKLAEENMLVRETELEQKLAILSEKEKSLAEQEKLFNKSRLGYEDRRVKLEQNARYLVGMPPDNAVEILLEMEDYDIIELFIVAEQLAEEEGSASLVSFWLSKMPAARAAELQRKFVSYSGA